MDPRPERAKFAAAPACRALICAAAAAFAGSLVAVFLMVALATAAFADADLTSDYFTPKIDFAANTTQAGDHPNLKIRMTKTPNRCPVPNPFGGDECGGNKPAYIEQDLKTWTIRFPEGMMADPQAAPKCNDPQPNAKLQYSCPSESQVGVISGKVALCTPGSCLYGPGMSPEMGFSGEIYNGTAGPGEQGHLYALVGPTLTANGVSMFFPAERVMRMDTSVRVTQPGFRIEAVTDQLPVFFMLKNAKFPVQLYGITMTLWGATGGQGGHPLLTNATFCQPRDLESVFQGYAGFSYVDDAKVFHGGTGTGATVTSSAPYLVSGCGKVPYDPQFEMSLSPPLAGNAPSINTSITQQDGEQTTSQATIRFPSVFKINTKSKVAPCPPDQIASDSCGPDAQLGVAKADSRLLPTGAMSGSAFLGQSQVGSFPLHLSLKGFIDLTFAGTVLVEPSGRTVATFANMPPVPLTTFAMDLSGGQEHGLLLNPQRCGDTTVTAAFVSHQGTEVERTVPLHVSCGRMSFKASLSTRKPRAHPFLTLAARATGIDKLAFGLPRALRTRRAARLQKGTYGSFRINLAEGSRIAKVVLRPKARRQAKFAAKVAGRRVAAFVLKGHKLVFTKLPHDFVSGALDLDGRKSRLLTNPPSCRKPLPFSMRAADPEARRYVVSRRIVTRCAKSHG